MKLTKEQKIYQQVVARAWEDDAFKDELIKNPVSAIENLTGERLNLEGKTIVVRDQTHESISYINIPTQPNIDNLQLTEEELEVIAGGGLGTFLKGLIKDIIISTVPKFPTL
jgi:hypothetical protein